MHAIIGKLAAAMNVHDLDAMVALFHPDYDSRQPVHPGRTFIGRAQVRANWGAMFAGVPDLRAELIGSAQDGDLNWSEWAWAGTRTDGRPFEMRGVTILVIRDGFVAEGRLYMEPVEVSGGDIEEAVRELYKPPEAPPA